MEYFKELFKPQYKIVPVRPDVFVVKKPKYLFFWVTIGEYSYFYDEAYFSPLHFSSQEQAKEWIAKQFESYKASLEKEKLIQEHLKTPSIVVTM